MNYYQEMSIEICLIIKTHIIWIITFLIIIFYELQYNVYILMFVFGNTKKYEKIVILVVGTCIYCYCFI